MMKKMRRKKNKIIVRIRRRRNPLKVRVRRRVTVLGRKTVKRLCKYRRIRWQYPKTYKLGYNLMNH
jgi:hypothetical protein